MRRGLIVLLGIILVLFTFSENEIYKKDIRNRLVIQGIGIDLEKDGTYTVTLQAIDTNSSDAASADGASQPPLKAYELTGETVYTAIKSVTEKEGKIPLYSQNRIILIGKSITKDKMDDVIDFFVRDVEVGGTVYIAAAEKRASEILKAKNGKELISVQNLESSIDSYEYDAKIFATRLYELINRYNSGTKDFALPLFSLQEKDDETSAEITGTALFDNKKYREVISKNETIYLNVLSDKVYNTAIAFDGDKGTRVSLNIVKAKTKRDVVLKNNIPNFKIKVYMDADIAEISGGVSNAMTVKQIEEIKNKGEVYIEKSIKTTIDDLYQKHNSDACGLTRLLYIYEKDFYRKNEKNIDSVLKKSLYEVDVELNIRRIGHEYLSNY
ncbi:MAG: Ger(x)C family spore germination protein [Clostridia bacterium]|nr:Ger(x)C family spore germination protein [Clostridia bacterium]